MAIVTVEGIRLVAEEFEGYPRRAQSAVVRAINRGMTAGRTVMARAMAKDMGIKVAVATKALRHRQATANTPEARLAAGFKRIPLIDFNARESARSRGRGRGSGVTYRMGAGNARTRLQSAFIVQMRSGHTGVFMRKGRARLPIVELHGPSPGQVFAKFRATALARAEEVFRTTLDHELSRLTGNA